LEAKKKYIEGLGFLTRGDLDAAVNSFEESVAADRSFGLGYLGLAQALDRLGQADPAIVAVRQAIELMPDDPLPHTSLSRLLQQKDMIEEAEAEMAISMRLQHQAEA
jgi:Flp pilus assembly protein TadD